MAYIAGKPVRFDRDYAIGERIPDSVIDPRAVQRLINMGRIIRTADDAVEEKPSTKEKSAESVPEGDTTISGIAITGEVVETYKKDPQPKTTKGKKTPRKK